MTARLDLSQTEQLARFVSENHDRIAGGITVTDSRPFPMAAGGRRPRALVIGYRRDGKITCEDYLFGKRVSR